MNKINQEIIDAKLRLEEITKQKELLEQEYQSLQDKIHLYFDSPNIDTSEAEKFIINYFWQNAYKNYVDGGYITNDTSIREIRFPYECMLIRQIIDELCQKRGSAIEIGCGNGDTCRFLAPYFDSVKGVDMSKEIIAKNSKENKISNLSFECKNAFEVKQKYDFVFASDMFMYSPDCDIDSMFEKLLNLLNGGGMLLIRESTKNISYEHYKSRNYIAYYRNFKFYEDGIFAPHFVKSYRNYGYNMYHLNKFFRVFGESKKEELKANPVMIENVVKEFVDPIQRSSYFYAYKK